jgi:hypothetical protein
MKIDITTKTLFAVVKGANPFYRRSYGVELIELTIDPRYHGKLYRQTSTGPVWYDTIGDAELDIACNSNGFSYNFATAWAMATRSNTRAGLPCGQEVAWN